jgi:hypothetical protein
MLSKSLPGDGLFLVYRQFVYYLDHKFGHVAEIIYIRKISDVTFMITSTMHNIKNNARTSFIFLIQKNSNIRNFCCDLLFIEKFTSNLLPQSALFYANLNCKR